MRVSILGTRGIPGNHGGFETFAEDLSLYLIARHHQVTVYCQIKSKDEAGEDSWNGVRRVLIASPDTALGTILFDWAAIWRSFWEGGTILTLGYNTGVFNFLHKLRGLPSVMNMDGLEWKRKKWSKPQRVWLWLNELAGANAATHLIADHPEIGRHLERHTSATKITVIPYGARRVSTAPLEEIRRFNLSPKSYYLVIARPEPENSVLEIVRTFSKCPRQPALVLLGTYDCEGSHYHRAVLEAAGPNVRFLGAIYDRITVGALRFHAKAYVHGHTVGGTNPSLVESLAVGNAIIAHDNRFNTWVAGESARYFRSCEELNEIIDSIESHPYQLFEMEAGSRRRHQLRFTQDAVLHSYEQLLLRVTHGEVQFGVEEFEPRDGIPATTYRGGTNG